MAFGRRTRWNPSLCGAFHDWLRGPNEETRNARRHAGTDADGYRWRAEGSKRPIGRAACSGGEQGGVGASRATRKGRQNTSIKHRTGAKRRRTSHAVDDKSSVLKKTPPEKFAEIKLR